jgi:hypothetical protein
MENLQGMEAMNEARRAELESRATNWLREHGCRTLRQTSYKDDIETLTAILQQEVWSRVVEKAQQASNDSASSEWILEWAKEQSEGR